MGLSGQAYFRYENYQSWKSWNQATWLGFLPKSYPRSFRSISYHFPSVRLKNIQIKISWLSTRQPTEVRKPTQAHYILHPNLSHIIFSHFVIISHQYGSKMFWSKFHVFCHENFPNLQTNPKWLGFVPKTSEHPFFCRFVVVWHKGWPRKFQVKISQLFQKRKLPKLTKLKIKPR